MVRGEPGLPQGFAWRDEERRIEEVLSTGKAATPDRGEMYIRRHTYRLRMDDGEIWNVYFLRQAPKALMLASGRIGTSSSISSIKLCRSNSPVKRIWLQRARPSAVRNRPAEPKMMLS